MRVQLHGEGRRREIFGRRVADRRHGDPGHIVVNIGHIYIIGVYIFIPRKRIGGGIVGNIDGIGDIPVLHVLINTCHGYRLGSAVVAGIEGKQACRNSSLRFVAAHDIKLNGSGWCRREVHGEGCRMRCPGCLRGGQREWRNSNGIGRLRVDGYQETAGCRSSGRIGYGILYRCCSQFIGYVVQRISRP